MIDMLRAIDAVEREVGSGRIAAGEGRSVRIQRDYDAPIDDVWDALTNPQRISRWFLPVSGDYRLGGRYQFEGNAGGEIVECARPNRLKVTWVYGVISSPADISEVEVRLTPAGDQKTTFVLEHTAIVPEDRWGEYGPGAVGVGWDLALLGLWIHLDGGEPPDHEEFESSPEAREYMTGSSEAWGAALAAAGASDVEVKRAVANTTAFYVPPAEAADEG